MWLYIIQDHLHATPGHCAKDHILIGTLLIPLIEVSVRQKAKQVIPTLFDIDILLFDLSLVNVIIIVRYSSYVVFTKRD